MSWISVISGRHLRSRLHHSWMIICLILVLLMPLSLGIGLYIKSAMLLESKSLYELLFSSEWRPLSGKFGFLAFIISSIWVTSEEHCTGRHPAVRRGQGS